MAVTFGQALAALEALAPLRWAEPWDNVGLLVEPPAFIGPRGRRRPLHAILLAIDASAAVVDEAVRRRCQLLVAYHPPIFDGLKALRASAPHTRALLHAVERGVAIYSPHTALDAAPGGLNDWLAASFGSRVRAEPIRPAPDAPPGVGQGRLLALPRVLSLAAVVARLKRHLGQRRLRVARAAGRPAAGIRTVALAAGAGGSLLLEALAKTRVDLLFTGEMRHHDVLAACAAGCHVVLAEHATSERGYLPLLRRELRSRLARSVPVDVARTDRGPLLLA